MRLDQYNKGSYGPGAPFWKQILWYVVGDWLVCSRYLPFSNLKVWILRMFGARIGMGVRIKTGVQIKFPWRLSIGDYSWIGERVWIDNLATVDIGAHCCISQSAYLCTGSHNWSKSTFDLITKPIVIKDHVWIAAKAIIGPGVTVGEGAVLGLGSTVLEDLLPWSIYMGNSAVQVKKRKV